MTLLAFFGQIVRIAGAECVSFTLLYHVAADGIDVNCPARVSASYDARYRAFSAYDGLAVGNRHVSRVA